MRRLHVSVAQTSKTAVNAAAMAAHASQPSTLATEPAPLNALLDNCGAHPAVIPSVACLPQRVEAYTLQKAANLVMNVDGCIGALFLDLLHSSSMFTEVSIAQCHDAKVQLFGR